MLQRCREQRGLFYTSSVLLSPIPTLSNFVHLSSATVKHQAQAAGLSVEEVVPSSFCILPHLRCVLFPWGLVPVAPERGFPAVQQFPTTTVQEFPAETDGAQQQLVTGIQISAARATWVQRNHRIPVLGETLYSMEQGPEKCDPNWIYSVQDYRPPDCLSQPQLFFDSVISFLLV